MRRGESEAQAGEHVRDFEARLDEATGLARAIDLEVAEAVLAPIAQIRPATYLGKGKVEEITGLVSGNAIAAASVSWAVPVKPRSRLTAARSASASSGSRMN